jgi:hypothetical protein
VSGTPCEFADIPLHRLARRVFAQHVEPRTIGLDFVDDEIRQPSMPTGLPAANRVTLRRDVNLEAV